MPDSQSKSLLFNDRIPDFVYIMGYQSERLKRETQSLEDLLKRVPSGLDIVSREPTLTVSVGSCISTIRRVEYEDCAAYILYIFLNKREVPEESEFHDSSEAPPNLQTLLDIFPKDRTSTLRVSIGHLGKLEDSFRELERLSHAHNRAILSAGIVRSCVLATLKEHVENAQTCLRRNLLLLSTTSIVGEAGAELGNLIEEMAQYAMLGGRLNTLFRERAVVFKQIDSSEASTQERIQDILSNIRRPPDQIEPADLGSMLTEVSGIFARLTTITGSMRRDYVTARSHANRIRGIFNSWTEKRVVNYPTNSSVEISRVEQIVSTFKDNADRLRALRTQLDTVLETIRTYVGIQQQNITVEEQRDTKRLLARMVDLQETLHKLEILIVAFYITEMGRLVFETAAHNMVNILTVAFIPIALLMAIAIRRLVHRRP